MIPLITLVIVFVLIALRQVLRVRLGIWQVMLAGALIVLATGQISPGDAARAIDPEVMVFLFCMFYVGRAMEESGYLSHLSYKLFRHAGGVDSLVLYVLFGFGLLSAVLMNDTCAIIGTPVMLGLARRHRIDSRLLLMALAFGITLGSVPSPIGNPQNLLIAEYGELESPFVSFAQSLLLPSLINLLLAYLVLKAVYGRKFHRLKLVHVREPASDMRLFRLCRVALYVIIAMISLKVVLGSLAPALAGGFGLVYISLLAMLPIILFSVRRREMLKGVDWHTLVFFASMFVLMQSVYDTSIVRELVSGGGASLHGTDSILIASVLLSQLVSNVPLVALYLPVLEVGGVGTASLMALAAGSTIAGNLLILGAASNVIIVENAEKRGQTLTFKEFARAGIPLTILNLPVFIVFL